MREASQQFKNAGSGSNNGGNSSKGQSMIVVGDTVQKDFVNDKEYKIYMEKKFNTAYIESSSSEDS